MEAFDVREFLRVCPGGATFTKADVLELLDRYDAIEEGTPGQIASRLGRSPKWWREAADAVGIAEGWAYVEESGRYRLNLIGARRYTERRRQRKSGGGLRGPRKKAATRTSTARARTARVLPGTMGRVGFETVGREARNSARPIASELATLGSENNR